MKRTINGGSRFNIVPYLRAWSHYRYGPSRRFNDLGFRMVRKR